MDPTVFRKLAELPYRTSYSHRGRYYTWDEAACFDDLGLWCFGSVWFSTYGTLLPTVAVLVEASEAAPLREPRRALKARDGRYNAQVLRLGWNIQR